MNPDLTEEKMMMAPAIVHGILLTSLFDSTAPAHSAQLLHLLGVLAIAAY
jgi:hypothetical protein